MSAVARLRDRTSDFRALLSAHEGDVAASSSSRLVQAPRETPGARGEFAKRAGAVAREIADTSAKLGRLAQLAKRKTLFDDRPVEISELTYIIKHDIAGINGQLSQLQTLHLASKAKPGAAKRDRAEEHRGNVVTLLQSRLAGATSAFQEVLEVRTKNMKASRDRSEQFAFSGGAPAPGQNSDSPLYKPHGGAQAAAGRAAFDPALAGADGYDPKAKGGGEFLALDMGQQQDQMLLMESGGNDAYLQQRSTAIESIESTISELGQIFGQLAHMVQEQGETVTRIDADVEEVGLNVDGAQRELLKYFANVSSNRWLMLKIFGVLIVFFLLFIVVS
ncbi:t-SNARE [Tilletiopsis washingtonensis]|uniref:t-SNARE n=1 Tax=Tilletiopsis washingtonensis TaxID=58919 RepID=A0A316Z451_9BASI|nr:t-SNARE [Tilletiopsis washingtonensis]PWN94975.1 t-SNARE [Tilletiopsis washingtonensis]